MPPTKRPPNGRPPEPIGEQPEPDSEQPEPLFFELSVPDPNERGYVGFLDDLVYFAEIAEQDTADPADWRAMMQFLLDRMTYPETDEERRALVREMSLVEYADAFSQLTAAIEEEQLRQKKSTPGQPGKSGIQRKGAKRPARPRGRGQ